MVIGEASVNAQPKKGIDSSSFLATNASGGKRKLSASVSQVEECLDMTMCGASRGEMFCPPRTRWRMPQISRAAARVIQHQPVMDLKRGTGGSQNPSRSRTAELGV